MEELSVLSQLGSELRGLGEPPRGRRLPVAYRRTLPIAVVLVALAAGAATAAIIISRGAPLPGAHTQDLQSSGVPIPGSAHLAGLDVPDPASSPEGDPAQPAWDMRISRTRDGETCTAVGQVLDGQFGIVGLDHVFRALALGGVDACGVASPDGPTLAGARVFVGGLGTEARTVVNGLAGAHARSVTAYGPEGAHALRLGPQGSFIAVYRGYVEEVRPRIVVVAADGASRTIAFASSTAFEVADPGGDSPWLISGGVDVEPGAYPEEDCAQASEQPGRSDPSRLLAPLTPEVCGRLGAQPLFVLMRRFVPGSGEGSGFPWGNNPARTLVYGAAARRVATLTLSGAGGARELAIDPHGGVFLAVLDGHVDPSELTLTAKLRDGTTIAYHGSTNLFAESSNRPMAQEPVPAYREPLPAAQAKPPPFALPIDSTVRETLHARDPAGGQEWALRSWQARPNPHARFGGHPGRFVCMQVGVMHDGTLVEPLPGVAPRPLSIEESEGPALGGCNEISWLAKHRRRPVVQVQSFSEHPAAYDPTPARTVVAGMLPPDASDPVLLGAGRPRALATDANHMVLAVLPGRYWDAPLRLSVREGGRTLTPSGDSTLPVPPALTVPQARAPDPDGSAPWGVAADANATAYGRIIDGRLGYVSEREGTVNFGPAGWGGNAEGCRRPDGGHGCHPQRRPQAVEFDAQTESEAGLSQHTPSLTRAQIERRTLPGLTIITGRASADVASVTIVTPRDVRTLRPQGPQHVFIVVYDGQFFRGKITAEILLRDGRTVTQPVPDVDSIIDEGAQRAPSLESQLQSFRGMLAAQREHRPGATPPPGSPPERLGARIRAIEGRIAYERGHPGVLPAP